jgi:hypothetical protein
MSEHYEPDGGEMGQSAELARQLSGEIEAETGNEVALPTADRYVIYGNREGGAVDLAHALQDLGEREADGGPDVQPVRFVDDIENAFFYPGLDAVGGDRTVPKGVIAFPHMRMDVGMTVTVDTPTEDIARLCEEFGVPLIIVGAGEADTEIVANLSKAIEQHRAIEGPQ